MRDNQYLFENQKDDPLNQLWTALKAVICYEYNQKELALEYIDSLLNHEIHGFRANEVMYLIHHMLLKITFAIKDKERITCLSSIRKK